MRAGIVQKSLYGPFVYSAVEILNNFSAENVVYIMRRPAQCSCAYDIVEIIAAAFSTRKLRIALKIS